MKILLVEDEISIAEPLEQILKKNKFSVDLAFNGEEGLAFGLSNIYDVILLDIMLPKINGLEVLQILRENGIKTPVLMLTAKGQIEDKIMGLDSGADDYLPKPFDKNDADRSHVEYHISFIRKKLNHMKATIIIDTIRGCGYYLKVKSDE